MKDNETGYYADGLSDGHAEAQATIDRLTAQLALAVEKQATLFAAIQHGNEEHREWLKSAIDNHFAPTDPDIDAAVQALQAGRRVLDREWLTGALAKAMDIYHEGVTIYAEQADAIIAKLKEAQ